MRFVARIVKTNNTDHLEREVGRAVQLGPDYDEKAREDED